jgi:hypothetical protein
MTRRDHRDPARLGLAGGDRQAAEATLRGLAADVQAITTAIASAQPADLDAARGRLEARGVDLGDVLDDLARRLEEIRRFNQQDVANAAVSGLRVLIDSIEDNPDQTLGRHIDELVARLERDVGSYAGQSPERSREQRHEEYRRDARSAIADSMRAAGFAPLNDPREEESRDRWSAPG